MIELRRGYLLFLGDVPLQLDAKTATGIAHWRPECGASASAAWPAAAPMPDWRT